MPNKNLAATIDDLLNWPDKNRRPSSQSESEYERKLAKLLSNKLYRDPDFKKNIQELFPDWFRRTKINPPVKLEELDLESLLSWPDKDKRPSHSSNDSNERSLARALDRLIHPSQPSFDRSFLNKLKKNYPNWFIRDSQKKKTEFLKWPHPHRRPSKKSADFKERRLADSYYRYAQPSSDQYDEDFHALVKETFPLWFQTASSELKDRLLKWPDPKRMPSSKSKDENEKQLGKALLEYISIENEKYDRKFHQEIKAKFPKWFKKATQKKRTYSRKSIENDPLAK